MSRAVLVDIDDTLADTQVKILEYVNSHAPQHYAMNQITHEFREGLNAEYDQLVRQFLASGDLVGQIEPITDAISGLAQLKEAGYEIHIASARQENLHTVTVDWLTRHGLSDYVHRIHPRFSHQRDYQFKLTAAREIDAVAAFDDTLSVIEALAAAVPKLYLINKPWNNHKNIKTPIIRVDSFAAAVSDFLAKNPARIT